MAVAKKKAHEIFDDFLHLSISKKDQDLNVFKKIEETQKTVIDQVNFSERVVPSLAATSLVTESGRCTRPRTAGVSLPFNLLACM